MPTLRELALKAEFGRVTVPLRAIRRFSADRRHPLVFDSHTICAWDFAGDHVNPLKDLVSGRRVQLPRGWTLRPDGLFASADRPATLELPVDPEDSSASFTIDVRFLESENAWWQLEKSAISFDVSDRSIRARDGDGRGFGFLDRPVSQSPWVTLTLVFDATTRSLATYQDGRAVPPVSANRLAWRRGAFRIRCPPQAIQWLRVSRIARTQAEIVDLHASQLWEPPAGTPGFVPCGGGFVAARLAPGTWRRLRTAWSSLAIDENTPGELHPASAPGDGLDRLARSADHLVDAYLAQPGLVRTVAALHLRLLGPLAANAFDRRLAASGVREREAIHVLRQRISEAPACDVLTFDRTVLHGWLDERSLVMRTALGDWEVDLRGVRSVTLGPCKPADGPLVVLRSGERIQARPRDRVTVDTVRGALPIPLGEVRVLTRNESCGCLLVVTRDWQIHGRPAHDVVRVTTPAGALAVPMEAIEDIASPDERALREIAEDVREALDLQERIIYTIDPRRRKR